MAKARTQRFGWTKRMAWMKSLAFKLPTLEERGKMLDSVKDLHAANCHRIMYKNVNKGGVRPLSRMHPEHPARIAFSGIRPGYAFECQEHQRFVP